MIKCENVVKKYITTTALDGLNVNIEAGKIVALLGPNGSGKSTLMKVLAGLIIPTSGSVIFEDEPLCVESKKVIAYMPTEAYFFKYMTCIDIAKYYKDFFEDFDYDKFMKLLEEMELNPKQKARQMSSGMVAKLKVAVTLSRNSRLIMLDEPLNGVDIIARDKIINVILSNITDEQTVIISSHLVDELEKVIDEAIFIKMGKCILAGNADSLRESHGKSIVDLYKELYV